MAVKIRLKRIGKKRAPHYRIVVMDARAKRDGRAIEEIGKYNPKAEPSFIHVESDRAQYWLGVGAQPTEAVAAIFRASGDWQKFKGLEAPAPLRVKEPKRDKQEIFNEALAEAHGTLKTEAVTKKAAAKKAEPKADKADKAEKKDDAAEAKVEEAAPAADAAATDAPADDAKA
ncbi:30S ribosomal protein S16 [Kribbella sp. NPDC056861]|uniref:30S ribosomal protein S16 n=1 Tax=Kribbella sp. NPDC056861 TaxID=3154857 RepID=UPI003435F292